MVTAQASLLATAQNYNVFVFGDFSSSGSDSEGAVAVGGNATLNSYGIGAKIIPSASTDFASLVVGGNLARTNGGESFSGTTYVGGHFSGQLNYRNGYSSGYFSGTSPVDFAAARTQLTALSTHLGTRVANGSTSLQYGALTLAGSDAGQNVFSVSGADLSVANSLYISVPTDSTVVINVDGSTVDFDNMSIFLGAQNSEATTSKDKILFNFTEATSLAISGISVKGSVLAPYANVDFSNGNLEGTLVALSVEGSGEYHLNNFTGSVTSVPEPGSFAMLLAGLGLLSLITRRREVKQTA